MQRSSILKVGAATQDTTASVQDYLAAIYDLTGSGKPVIGARLAKHMAISAPAVTEAIHRMARGGYVKIGRGKELTLSPKGRQIAEVMARRARGGAPPRARALAAGRGPAGRAARHAKHVPARQPHSGHGQAAEGRA